jgi:hypothetical protein
MESYLEQYEAREGGVTLHTWTDLRGAKKENFYIIGMGCPVPRFPPGSLMLGHFGYIPVSLELDPRYKVLIQPWFLLEQTDHRTDQAQLTMSATARRHSLQQGTRLLVPLQQQPCCQTHHDQQRDGK